MDRVARILLIVTAAAVLLAIPAVLVGGWGARRDIGITRSELTRTRELIDTQLAVLQQQRQLLGAQLPAPAPTGGGAAAAAPPPALPRGEPSGTASSAGQAGSGTGPPQAGGTATAREPVASGGLVGAAAEQLAASQQLLATAQHQAELSDALLRTLADQGTKLDRLLALSQGLLGTAGQQVELSQSLVGELQTSIGVQQDLLQVARALLAEVRDLNRKIPDLSLLNVVPRRTGGPIP